MNEKTVDGFANLLADTSLSCDIGMNSELYVLNLLKRFSSRNQKDV